MTGSSDDARPGETPTQRADRNWNELLQELRVAQTGVQVLAGFLLTLPFQQRFTRLDHVQVGVYLTAVLFATLAVAMLVAPVSSHRLLFHRHKKQVLVETSNRLAKIGLTFLGLAVGTVTLLIFDVVVGRGVAVAVAVAMLVVFALTWVVLPLSALSRAEGHGTN
ncbi:DUF6328 family protein [Oryzihumus sp.]|uniref:DUF6328 family protein n=1 Tax=Oryzihumus sp. TaxID=1968903 RepID=UPI002EDB1F8F